MTSTELLDDAEAGAPRRGREARRKYWVDVALLATWIVAAIPGLTGITLHEWIGLGLIVVLLTHVVMHWNWVVRQLTRLRVRTLNQVNRLVDLAMWGSAILVMLSGVVISEAALPALGLHPEQTTMWIRVHALSSALLLVVLAVHLLQHLGWVWAQTKAIFGGAR